MNKTQRNERNTPGQSQISTPNSSCSRKENLIIVQIQKASKLNTEFTEMARDNYCHFNKNIMEIARRRNNSPETRRLIEQRNTLSHPGTRRRYGHHTQRTVFAPSRPNKKSRKEIAKFDAELISDPTGWRLPADNRRW